MVCISLINPGESMVGFVDSCRKKKSNIYIIFDSNYAAKYKSIYEKAPNTTINKITNEELVTLLGKIQKDNELTLVIGCHDNTLKAAAVACSKLGIPFSSPDSIDVCRNKYSLRHLLHKNSSIAFGDINNSIAGSAPLNYPVICKPKCGWGSNWAEQICSDEEFCEYVERTASLFSPSEYSQWFYGEILDNGYFWEEWIDGPVITAELFIDNKRIFIPMLSIAHQFPGTCFGAGTMIPFAPSEKVLMDIENGIKSIINITNISHGVFDIEMKLTEYGIHIIDINARPMGGEMIRAFNTISNVSFSDLYIDFFTSIDIPEISYSSYSATHKVMCDDVILESNVKEYLKRTNAITYVHHESFPLEPETILARYITKSFDPHECLNLGKQYLQKIIQTTSIMEPDYRSTKDVISSSQREGSYHICGSIVSFAYNIPLTNLKKEDLE